MSNEKNEEQETKLPEADRLQMGTALSVGIRLILATAVLCSVLYPSVITGVGNLLWKNNSRGSLIDRNGEYRGSKLIGQSFNSDKYFHPRPSSTGYDATNSGSANLAPTNDRLIDRSRGLVNDLKAEGLKPENIPASFVTESGSALDPHIVPESAYLQIPRVSEATGIQEKKLAEMVEDLTRGKLFGLYGLRRVNVLLLNLKVDNNLESR